MRTLITIDKLTPKIKYKILHFLFNAPLAINIRYHNKNPFHPSHSITLKLMKAIKRRDINSLNWQALVDMRQLYIDDFDENSILFEPYNKNKILEEIFILMLLLLHKK